MSGVTRRHLLHVGLGLSVTTAGCLSNDSSSPAARVGNIQVRHIGGDGEHVVDVTVEANGESVFSETYHLEPGAERTALEVATEKGEYIVRVGFDDAEREVDVTEEAGGEDVCVNLRFDLWRDDDGDPQIATVTQPPYDDC